MWNDSPAQITFFEVDHPRAGLPATFVVKACDIGGHLGDVLEVRRRGTGTRDDVSLHPLSGLDLVGLWIGLPAAGFVIAAAWWLARGLIGLKWDAWVQAGRPGDGGRRPH
ncbi:hypothetical protein GCM10022223_61590 [Kineosporia mesophila]|uniref:PepSY domain-containing protein n=1 Tax=Kineosporia mesophila TaxID=566012 RepID=A0ABP7AKT6_9ACTN